MTGLRDGSTDDQAVPSATTLLVKGGPQLWLDKAHSKIMAADLDIERLPRRF